MENKQGKKACLLCPWARH